MVDNNENKIGNLLRQECSLTLSYDVGRYHIETSPLICGVNQWTGFYMISSSVMKGLKDRSFWKLVFC